MRRNIHIALDLDKSLAYYESHWRAKKIGPPIQKMIDNVNKWLAKGYKITIFTARMSHIGEDLENQKRMIKSFLFLAGLPNLDMTCIKHQGFTHFIDDKAYHCVPNTGEILNCPEELL